MQKQILKIFLLLVFFLSLPHFSHAANFPLEITNIKPAGTGSPAIPSTNRIFRAYPGIAYNIRPAVSGGTYPFTFSLSGQPSGMTINSSTGEINWPNPQSNSGTITLSVTDSESSNATTTWAITVSTSGFYFVDSAAETNGSGTISSPFNSWTNMMSATTGQITAIVYFRSGTHTLTEYNRYDVLSTDNTVIENHPSQWLAYPGETVNINSNNIRIYTANQPIYFDGFNVSTMDSYFLHINSKQNYHTIRRNNFSAFTATYTINDNQGVISLSIGGIGGGNGYYTTIQDNTFTDGELGCAIGSIYNAYRLLIEDNTVTDWGHGDILQAGVIAPVKNNGSYLTFRGNKIDVSESGLESALTIYGGASIDSNYIEIDHNIIRRQPGGGQTANSVQALEFFKFANYIWVHHNTMVGHVILQDVGDGDQGGPYSFYNNVIINSNSQTYDYQYYTFKSGTGTLAEQYATITDSTNLKSASETGTIDSDFKLVNRSYVGTYGWEVGGESDTTPPAAPASLSVV